MDGVLYRLGRGAVRHRGRVLAIWLAALVGIAVLGRASGGHFRNDFTVKGVGSQTAADLLQTKFPQAAGASAQVVVHAPSGTLRSGANAEALVEIERSLAAVPHVDAVIGPSVNAKQLSPSGTVALVNVSYDESVEGLGDNAMKLLQAATAPATRAGLDVEFGGQLPSADAPAKSPPSEAIGLIAAVIILLFAFGSVIAMGLPICTALFGVGTGVAIVTLLAKFVTFPTVSSEIAIMIGLGVGIDYSLFILTRYRSGLNRGLTVPDAAGRALATAGQAVLVAGCTVVIAILGLAVAGVPALTFMGLASAIVVAVMMTAALTLLPALLGFAGHNIDKLHVGRLKHEGEARDAEGKYHGWAAWGHHVAKYPWPYLVASLTILLVLAAPFLQMRLGEPDASNDHPKSSTLRRAYDLLAEGFGVGVNGPLVLAVDLSKVPPAIAPRTADAIAAAVKAAPDVASVTPALLNEAKDAAVIEVTPASSPQAAATGKLVKHLRDDVLPATTSTGARTYVGGPTAAFIDVSNRLAERLPVFIGCVIGLSFLLLMWVFRSLFVPLKAAVMNLLSIGAAYGVIVAIFQKQWGASLVGVHSSLPIVSFVPMFMFAVLFGLSMDYEVFLLSRIREEYNKTHDNTDSVVTGIGTTARVITSAALIMTAVFLAFVLNDDPTVKMLGIGLAVAVLVDATIVRVVLVPAAMRLLGDANWWLPKWLQKLLPDLDIEGEHKLPSPEFEHPEPEREMVLAASRDT